MTHDELKAYLKEKYGGYSLFEPESYDEAIIGVTEDGGVVYSYDKLAEALILHDNMSYEDAIEWLDFNTVRTVPYIHEYQPTILMGFPDCDDEWLIGVDQDGRPVYFYDNIPPEPVKHECLEDYMLLDDDAEIPEPVIVFPLEGYGL